MQPPSLADLRQAVQIRLRDFERAVKNAEIDAELNRQLDLWTRENDVVQVSLISDILAGSNPQTITPAAGYQVGRILKALIRQNGMTIMDLEIRSPQQMYNEFIDWPDTSTNDSLPMFLILDFDPNTNAHVLTQSAWLWPGPNLTLPGGLVIVCKAVTDGLLKTDATQIPVQAMYAKEQLVEGTCAALSIRRKDLQAAEYHQGEAKRDRRQSKRAQILGRVANKGSRAYFT